MIAFLFSLCSSLILQSLIILLDFLEKVNKANVFIRKYIGADFKSTLFLDVNGENCNFFSSN